MESLSHEKDPAASELDALFRFRETGMNRTFCGWIVILVLFQGVVCLPHTSHASDSNELAGKQEGEVGAVSLVSSRRQPRKQHTSNRRRRALLQSIWTGLRQSERRKKGRCWRSQRLSSIRMCVPIHRLKCRIQRRGRCSGIRCRILRRCLRTCTPWCSTRVRTTRPNSTRLSTSRMTCGMIGTIMFRVDRTATGRRSSWR